jgi:nucleoside-diphosphate-sugar epimerase
MTHANVQNSKVLLTGSTGFIGSHIGRALVEAGYPTLCLKRKTSKLDRCAGFHERVIWIDRDAPDWSQAVIAAKPQAVIHCAWAGITAAGRDDWNVQVENVVFFLELMLAAGAAGVKQFIAFGSQAEYGPIEGRVNENQPCRPSTAYGSTKLACLTLLEAFTRSRQMTYAWLRLFSIYGPGEGPQWFIPGLIRQLKSGQPPQLTACEQRYDYLHVHDLASAVLAVLRHPDKSGVFNVSSNTSLPLKQVVQLIQKYAAAKVEPVFGASPNRPGQSMHLEGDSTRFSETFAFKPQIALAEGLRQLVEESSVTPAGPLAAENESN